MTELVPITDRRRLADEDADLRRALQRFIEGRLRDRSESEDLVQETYLRLYDYRRTRSVADVGAFCFAIARNLIQDHLRRLRVRPAGVELVEDTVCPAPRADEILAYRERVDLLTRALRAMPPLRREVFIRRRLEEQPVATIAVDMGLGISAVEKHVVRALADLRAALARRGLGLEEGA
jgi:RNA polymerase sigma-70 factor (ECF subfamily)